MPHQKEEGARVICWGARPCSELSFLWGRGEHAFYKTWKIKPLFLFSAVHSVYVCGVEGVAMAAFLYASVFVRAATGVEKRTGQQVGRKKGPSSWASAVRSVHGCINQKTPRAFSLDPSCISSLQRIFFSFALLLFSAAIDAHGFSRSRLSLGDSKLGCSAERGTRLGFFSLKEE